MAVIASCQGHAAEPAFLLKLLVLACPALEVCNQLVCIHMVLYHYCSCQTFLSIVESRSIRLSSLTQSNDAMEGRLIREAISRLAKRDGLAEDQIARMHRDIQVLENTFDGLGFCLSEDGDLLSQWRGYAVDGCGLSIGFDQEYLARLAREPSRRPQKQLTLTTVAYSLEEHDELIKSTYEEVCRLMANGEWRDASHSRINLDISLASQSFFSQLFRLKGPAFREEKEWRLLGHSASVGLPTDARHLRAVNDRLIPYRTIDILPLEQSPIVRVLLGPKHKTPVRVIQAFLRECGFGEVKVHRSTASYR